MFICRERLKEYTMKKSYYLFNPGRLQRRDNTFKFVPTDEEGRPGTPKFLPVEGVEEFFVFGSLDVNSALLNYLGQKSIMVHYFDYYENYTGSFMPRDYLLSGKMLIQQVAHYTSVKKRGVIARTFLEGAAFNMLRTLKYYSTRGYDVAQNIERIDALQQMIKGQDDIPELMGTEGNMRMAY